MKKMTQLKKLLSIILSIALIAAVALFTIGCADSKNNNNDGGEKETEEEKQTFESVAEDEINEVGEGDTKFTFIVADAAGNEVKFTVSTNKTIVGEALQDAGLVEGEEGPYGLYIKKVYGIVADYEVDGTYWAFYVNGDYAATGVDKTEINTNDIYMLKVSK